MIVEKPTTFPYVLLFYPLIGYFTLKWQATSNLFHYGFLLSLSFPVTLYASNAPNPPILQASMAGGDHVSSPGIRQASFLLSFVKKKPNVTASMNGITYHPTTLIFPFSIKKNINFRRIYICNLLVFHFKSILSFA